LIERDDQILRTRYATWVRCPIGLALSLVACAHSVDAARELIPHPANARRQIEVYWRKPPGPGPFPLIVFVHGHQGFGEQIGGRVYADLGALRAANADGAVAVAVSQPGYGGSDGPADFCGPFTQDAVIAAIDRFRSEPFVDKQRVVLEGVSRGAIVSAMVAARDTAEHRLAGAVLISGAYDLQALYDAGFGGLSKLNLWSEAGPTSARVFADRSAFAHLEEIHVPLLILHGERDGQIPVAQATSFAEALRTRSRDVELHVFAGEGHPVPYGKREPFVRAFVARVTR
jgi:dipeptidyl aminopeptidase/acylaminoacyl peptidase